MTLIDALIENFGNAVALPTGGASFRAVGSVGSIMRDEIPTGLTIPGLQSDKWRACFKKDLGATLSTLFADDLPKVVYQPVSLTSLFEIKADKKDNSRLSDLLSELPKAA